tara:strand:- start:402 stop:1157 length:756 start_codon:yes stop_codon:yes gene_type:complete
MNNTLCYCNGNEISNVNYLIYSFTVIPYCISLSIFSSSWLVAKFIWKPYVQECLEYERLLQKEEEKAQPKPKKYIELYSLEEDSEFNLETFNDKNKSVMEATPDGNVIMSYNKDDELWEYWADKNYKNNISFDSLDVVCRKYCKTYQCSPLYVDRLKNIEDLKKAQEERIEREKMAKEDKKQDEDSDDELFVKANTVTNKKKKVICAEKSNKYRYKGEIKEFGGFNVKYDDKKIQEDVSWSSWKMWKNKNN